MTNMGIVLPDEGYHEALRELTRKHGTLLIIDETHTFSAGAGGCTEGLGPRARPLHDRQGDRLRRAGRRPRHDRRGRPQRLLRPGRRRLRRHRWRRWHPRRQRALDGGGPGDPLRGADRRGLRVHDPAGDPVHRRGPVGDRRERPALERHPAGRPRRVPVRSGAGPQRDRSPRGLRRRPRAVPPHPRAEPRRADHAFPQHGADVARRRPRPTSTATPRSFATRSAAWVVDDRQIDRMYRPRSSPWRFSSTAPELMPPW